MLKRISMKLLIGIGTFKRISKLERLLESLRKQTFDNFVVVVSIDNDDLDTYNYIQSLPERKTGKISCVIHHEQVLIIGHWNHIVKNYFHWLDADAFIGLCDDVELYPNTLEKAALFYQEQFEDYDGVLGFHQECPGNENYSFKYFGQTMIGKKFIERYKEVDYKICCPLYKFLYQDEELFQYANSLNKFYPCKEAVLKHYHPGFLPEEIDETHYVTRKGVSCPKQIDTALFNQRQKENKLWPIT